MQRKAKIILFVLALTLLTACGQTNDRQTAGVEVKDAWARPALNGENSAAYFTVENHGSQDDVLTQAACDCAKTVELHKSSQNAEGMMSMQPQAEVPIPAGQSVKFEAGGLHVMLIGLTQDLKAQDTIHLTLTFSQTGKVELDVSVKEP